MRLRTPRSIRRLRRKIRSRFGSNQTVVPLLFLLFFCAGRISQSPAVLGGVGQPACEAILSRGMPSESLLSRLATAIKCVHLYISLPRLGKSGFIVEGTIAGQSGQNELNTIGQKGLLLVQN